MTARHRLDGTGKTLCGRYATPAATYGPDCDTCQRIATLRGFHGAIAAFRRRRS